MPAVMDTTCMLRPWCCGSLVLSNGCPIPGPIWPRLPACLPANHTVAAWPQRTLQGADPAARDGEARTPLHHAVMRGHCGVVDVLLSRGGPALLLAKDILGCTPVHLAAVQNQVRCKAGGAVLCCVHGLQTGCWSVSHGSCC